MNHSKRRTATTIRAMHNPAIKKTELEAASAVMVTAITASSGAMRGDRGIGISVYPGITIPPRQKRARREPHSSEDQSLCASTSYASADSKLPTSLTAEFLRASKARALFKYGNCFLGACCPIETGSALFAFLNESLPQCCISQRLCHAAGHVFDGMGIEVFQHTAGDLRKAGSVGSHYRNAARHRLHQGKTKAFIERGNYHQAGALDQQSQIMIFQSAGNYYAALAASGVLRCHQYLLVIPTQGSGQNQIALRAEISRL